MMTTVNSRWHLVSAYSEPVTVPTLNINYFI